MLLTFLMMVNLFSTQIQDWRVELNITRSESIIFV